MEVISGLNMASRGPEHGLGIFALMKEQKTALIGLLAALMAILAIMKFFNPLFAVAACIALPVAVVLLLNTETMLIGVILSLFIGFQIRYMEISVWMAFPFLASFMLTRVHIAEKPVSASPLTKPFFLYVGASVLSLANTHDIFFSLFMMINLFAMAAVAYLIGEFVSDEATLDRSIITFVAGCVLNGFAVIGQSLISGGRSFGFTKIVYVDIVCMGIVVMVILMIAMRRSHLRSLSAIAAFLFFALFFTQTRNTLASLAMALGFLFLYLLKHGHLFNIGKRRLFVAAFIVLVSVTAVVGTLLLVYPQVFERLAEVGSKKSVELRSEVNFGTNSLITRLLLWHTSVYAFLQHPIIGIGAFAFIRDSRYYYTIPTTMYKLFVQGASPHETYLSVLVETGIVGFVAFITFLVAAIKMGLRLVRKASSERHRLYALGLLALQVYIISSMVMTDSWLMGQCGMAWGCVLGYSIALQKLIDRQAVADGSR